MSPEEMDATVKNPRWWVALPLLLLLAVFLAFGWLLAKPLWWLGQSICGLSNVMSPHAPTPKPIKAILDWVRSSGASP